MADKNMVGLSYQPPQDSDLMNLVFPELKTPVVDSTYTDKYFNYSPNASGTVDAIPNYGTTSQIGLVPEAGYLAKGAIPGQTTDTIGDMFAKYKTGIAAGMGLGQLGLGYLNYTMNKKGLESNLATAAQKRDLLAKAQANRENIASKARNALRFG